MQLLLLLFADDVALLARTRADLERIYLAFRTFCQANHLTISASKTKAFVVGSSEETELCLGDDTFEVVTEFKYLGFMLDTRASAGHMIQHRLAAARGGYGGLCEFLGVQQWYHPWIRLVLFDVYVRTQLTFGAPVWSPRFLVRGLGLGQ